MHGTRRALVTAIVSGVALASLATTCLGASGTWPVTLSPGGSGESAATGLTVTGVTVACAPGGGEVTLSWNPVAVPAGYRVWEAAGTGPYTTVASNLTTTTWTSGALTSGTYRFAVSTGAWHSWTSPLSTPTTPVVIASTTPTCTVG